MIDLMFRGSKDTDKRARNTKFTWIFFAASGSIFEVYLKDSIKKEFIKTDKLFS